jgi:hypothetical protein
MQEKAGLGRQNVRPSLAAFAMRSRGPERTDWAAWLRSGRASRGLRHPAPGAFGGNFVRKPYNAGASRGVRGQEAKGWVGEGPEERSP